MDFDLEGPNGLLGAIESRLNQRGHAAIVVAEGAGQKFFENKLKELDASGNIKLKDIGLFLKDEISSYFKAKNIEISILESPFNDKASNWLICVPSVIVPKIVLLFAVKMG